MDCFLKDGHERIGREGDSPFARRSWVVQDGIVPLVAVNLRGIVEIATNITNTIGLSILLLVAIAYTIRGRPPISEEQLYGVGYSAFSSGYLQL